MEGNSNNVMTAYSIAKELGVGLNFVYKELRAGNIPARRVGDRWFMSRKAFEEWLAGDKAKVGAC